MSPDQARPLRARAVPPGAVDGADHRDRRRGRRGLHRVARPVGHARRTRSREIWSAWSTSTPAWPGWRSTWPSDWRRVASLLYLWPRTRSLFWDRLAAAAVEVGVVFNVCTLISGSIWGKPTWGVWWAWDARLTSTAVLLVLFLGYLALRRVPAEPDVRAKRSAFVALFAAVDIPIVHFSVLWWKTLHQGATVLNPDLSPTIHGSMAWTLLLGFVALTLVFVWMLLVRYRIGVLEDWLGAGELDVALPERRPRASRRVATRCEAARCGYVVAGYVIVLGDRCFLYAAPSWPGTPSRLTVRRGPRHRGERGRRGQRAES